MKSINLQQIKVCSILLFFALFGNACSKKFIYHPEREIIATPAKAEIFFEDINITTEDGIQINAWFVPFEGSPGVLLWFHGNAGNIGNRVNLLQRLHHELKLNILIIDYRGYGKSEGKISEEGTAKDARAAYDFLISRKEVDPKQIFILGRSLGAAVAIQLAIESHTAGLILDAPFTSIQAMAQETLPWLPFKGLISTKYNSLKQVKKIDSPILIMHGDQDKVIPLEQGQALFEAANQPKTFFTIRGADHNNAHVVGGPAYFEALAQFISKYRK